MAGDACAIRSEFSDIITKPVNGTKYQARGFAKGDRRRLEY
jgi:hypothetical protein